MRQHGSLDDGITWADGSQPTSREGIVMEPPSPPLNPYSQPPPRRKRHALRWVLAAIGVLILLGIIAAIAGSTDAGKTATGRGLPVASPTEPYGPPPATTEATQSAGLVYATPTKADLRITLKILTKDCFGEAGCNVTYRPQLTQLGVGNYDPSITYDVTYEVRGGQDGAQVDTMQMTGDKYQANEGAASTASSATKLTAVITSVEAE